MVRRYRDGTRSGFETKSIHRQGEAATQTVVQRIRRELGGRPVSDKIEPWDGYDPRQRPWFTGHSGPNALHWTDVYPFFTDRAAGITGSIPVLDDAGEPVIVVGADVKLENLSRFLRSLVVGKTGLAVIVDDDGRVIAHPQMELVKESADGTLRLTRVSDLGDEVLSRAFDHYRVQGHGRREFELEGRQYITAVSSLNHLLQRGWSVLVVAPEDDFVGFVARNVGKTLGMGLAVIGLAAIFAAFLVRRGLRTDRDAMLILERQAQLDAQAEVFDLLATRSALSATGFDDARAMPLAPLTAAVARAVPVRRVSLWELAPAGDALLCLDCFDQETAGHTKGLVLRAQDHPDLFAILDEGLVVSDPDAPRNARLATLAQGYLAPLGCTALLLAPITAGGQVQGALFLEDARRSTWHAAAGRLARAVASMLALREVGIPAAQRVAMASPAEMPPIPDKAGQPADRGFGAVRDIDTGLGARRASLFLAKLAQQADSAGVASAAVMDRLAVMSLRFTDAATLAERVKDGTDETLIACLVDGIEAAAAEHGMGYLRFLTDQVVAAAEPSEDAAIGAMRLADFALAVQATCERLFAEQHAALAFRIGLDLGPVIGTLIGRERRSFNLWGEAAQMAGTMADTGLPGAIHATESVYQTLQGRYLFQLRGRHYLEGIGEFSTYLLSGRT